MKTDLERRIPYQLSDPACLGKYNIWGLWRQTFTFLIYFLISSSMFVFQEFGFTCTLPSAWNLDFQIQRKLWSSQGKKKSLIFHAILEDDCEDHPDTSRPKGKNVLSQNSILTSWQFYFSR